MTAYRVGYFILPAQKPTKCILIARLSITAATHDKLAMRTSSAADLARVAHGSTSQQSPYRTLVHQIRSIWLFDIKWPLAGLLTMSMGCDPLC